jgi:hypothetical protein
MAVVSSCTRTHTCTMDLRTLCEQERQRREPNAIAVFKSMIESVRDAPTWEVRRGQCEQLISFMLRNLEVRSHISTSTALRQATQKKCIEILSCSYMSRACMMDACDLLKCCLMSA